MCHKTYTCTYISTAFTAPLTEGQQAIVMAFCLSCVRPFICMCIHKLFLAKTPQKLLTGFLPNFMGMFLKWAAFRFLQIIVFHEKLWLQ